MTDASTPLTVAGIVRAIRRSGSAGEPVPAAKAAAWGGGLMAQLYGPQKPVRYECRAKFGAGPWTPATDTDVMNARRRGLEVRALYLHPNAEKPAKAHRFHQGRCRDCGELDLGCGPDCEVPAPTPDARAALPFDPIWFREPLEALLRIATHRFIGVPDSMKWKTELPYLLERLDQYDKETQA